MSNQSSKSELYNYYIPNPSIHPINRKLGKISIEYFYFDEHMSRKTPSDIVLNGVLLEGKAKLEYKENSCLLDRFDMCFVPNDSEFTIIPEGTSKLCLVFSETIITEELTFILEKFSLDKFIPRGELSSNEKISTYRTVWTAIKNGHFMSGYTNIPNKSLQQGVITSVNLEKEHSNTTEIYPHIHPDYPELYIFCIDDEKYAMTQYLIDSNGQSVCKDLPNGEGVFFPGYLGHMNFAKPNYKEFKYCMYMWIIPTFGETTEVSPITLRTNR